MQATPGIQLGGGCVLHVDPNVYITLSTVTANSKGEWTSNFSIPNMPAWVGIRVALQGVFPGRGAFGIDFTNGLVWNLGY